MGKYSIKTVPSFFKLLGFVSIYLFNFTTEMQFGRDSYNRDLENVHVLKHTHRQALELYLCFLEVLYLGAFKTVANEPLSEIQPFQNAFHFPQRLLL